MVAGSWFSGFEIGALTLISAPGLLLRVYSRFGVLPMAAEVKKSTERLPSTLPLDQAHDLFAREAWRLAGVSAEVFLAR
jgi:hypothetical protein